MKSMVKVFFLSFLLLIFFMDFTCFARKDKVVYPDHINSPAEGQKQKAISLVPEPDSVVYPIDVGIDTILIPSFALAGSPLVINVIAHNYGSIVIACDVVVTAPSGYTATYNVFIIQGAAINLAFPIGIYPAGPICFTACAVIANDGNLSNQCKTACTFFNQTLTEAYGFVLNDTSGTFQQGPVKFYLEHPESLTQIAVNTSNDYLVSGTWGNDPTNNPAWYTTEIYNPPLYNHGYLIKINPVTGAYTNIGQLGVNIDGLSYDYASAKLWGIGSTLLANGYYALTIYEINMITGQAVLAANLGFTKGKVQGLACHASSMLFFTDTGSDEYFSLDPFTFSKEMVGSLGMDFNLQQDLEFNRADGELYLSGHDSVTVAGGLYKVNPATGMSSLVNNFPNGLEMTGFAIPYTPVISNIDIGIMWIENPRTGPLTNNEYVTVKIRNYSGAAALPLADFNISYQVGTGPVITEPWALTGFGLFLPGSLFSYTFSTATLDLSTPGANYCIRAWVWGVPADSNQANDSTAKCVTNTLCTIANPCYPNSKQEPELCSGDLDGGCSSTTPAYVNIVSGDAWCGTVWKVDTLADQDWYQFTIASGQTIYINAKTEFPLDLSIISLPCSNRSIVMSKFINKCTEDSLVNSNLPAGTYAIRIRPDMTTGQDIICSFSNQYSLKFETSYCIPAATNYSGTDAYIMKVSLDSISNNSGFSAGGYADYKNISTSLLIAQPFVIKTLIHYYSTLDSVSVFVDWNQNQDFMDVGETFKLAGITLGSDQLFQGIITMPANIQAGPRLMRVRVIHDTIVDPCGDYDFSEAEDYTLNIIPPPPHITTTIGSLSGPCQGIHDVSIMIDSCYNIQQIHLNITVSPGITLMGYNSPFPSLNGGTLSVTQNGTQILIDWFFMIPASPGSGLLLNLTLNIPQGTNYLVWTPGPDSSYYASSMGYLNASWIGSTLVFGNCADLSGNVYYAQMTAGVSTPKLMGNWATSCDSIQVRLLQGTTLVDTACPDYYGNYNFTNLPLGNYTVTALIRKRWGSVNAIDAQMVQMNFTHFNNFYLGAIYVKAGDVNGYGVVPNSADALLIMKRYVGLIQYFMPPYVIPGKPNWYSESYPIIINGTMNQTRDIYALCTGDVNGSFQTTFPPKSQVMINHEAHVAAGDGVTELPVYAEHPMNVGSISMALNYPPELKVLEVTIKNSPDNLVYLAKDGHLRLAWYSLDPLILYAGEVLFTMKVKTDHLTSPAIFENTAETILSDGLANIIEGASFTIPKIVPSASMAEISLENVPNPFSSVTEIRYTLPNSGTISIKLYNVLGEEISTLFEGVKIAGIHSIRFDGTPLGKGIYFYRLQTQYGSKVRTMVVSN